MATNDKGHTATGKVETRAVAESGFEKRGGYGATQMSNQLPKVDSGPAPGATTGQSGSGGQPAGGSRAQSGAS
jgi:hypothetical protein